MQMWFSMRCWRRLCGVAAACLMAAVAARAEPLVIDGEAQRATPSELPLMPGPLRQVDRASVGTLK
jgi:hypothetical protein